MADLKIQITGALNPTTTVTEINKGIEKLQGKVDKLNLSIKIDNSVLNTITKLASQLESVAEVAKNTGKTITESINPDGSRTIVTAYDGIVRQIEQLGTTAQNVGKQIQQSSEQQQAGINNQQQAVRNLTSEYQTLTREVKNLNQQEEATKLTQTYQNGNNTLKVTQSATGTNYTETLNYAKDAQDAQKLSEAQDKLTQSLKKMYDQGIANEQFFTNFNKAIDSAKNLQEIDKLQAGLQRVSQYAKNQNLQANLLSQSQGLLDSGKNVDTTGIQNLVTRLNELNLSGTNATRELSLMQNELRGFQGTATTAAEEIGVLGNTFKNMATYFGGYMIFSQVFNSIKDGISTVNSLNKSLTEISIVTYQNQQQVAALGESYNKLAIQMGVTTKDITQEAAELYRQGLSGDQVTERMKTITEYAKISSLDTKTATEIMTAAINSMGVSATKAADSWSFLGDQTATGADEIGKAMQKVGSTAGELNVPFDLVSSWIAVISSKTRLSAETIGDSVKSILARMQSLKERGFDSTDGSTVNNVAKSLSAVGVQLMDSSGNFRNFGDVLKDLSDKWGNLSNRQKAYLATTVAGKSAA